MRRRINVMKRVNRVSKGAMPFSPGYKRPGLGLESLVISIGPATVTFVAPSPDSAFPKVKEDSGWEAISVNESNNLQISPFIDQVKIIPTARSTGINKTHGLQQFTSRTPTPTEGARRIEGKRNGIEGGNGSTKMSVNSGIDRLRKVYAVEIDVDVETRIGLSREDNERRIQIVIGK